MLLLLVYAAVGWITFSLRQSEVADTMGPVFMTSSRLIIAFIVTVGVGLVVLRARSSSILKPAVLPLGKAADHVHDHSYSHDDEKPERLVLAMRTAMRDFMETVFKAYVTDDLVILFNQNEVTGIGLMMVLAFVLSLCSTSDAFIAANFPVPQSAKLAFLVFGPMMDVKLVFMYLSVFKSRFVALLAISIFIAIGFLSYVWIRL